MSSQAPTHLRTRSLALQQRGDVAFRLFFLGCVVVAGLFGAATAFIDILFVQALPAALAFAATLAARPRAATASLK